MLFNGLEDWDYPSLIRIQGKKVTATPVERIERNTESTLQTQLLQAVGKPEHVDILIQKATELGISQILLFNSQYTQTPLKNNRLEKKMAHWKSIAISACEQCGRNRLPSIEFSASLQEALRHALPGNKILLNFDGHRLTDQLQNFSAEQAFCMLVGPEGGFSESELEFARKADFESYILGPRVLRMETAAISIVTLIQHHFGDMG